MEAVSDKDIVVTGTNSANPVLVPSMIRNGQHINAMGVKTEIDTQVFRNCIIIADSTEVACSDVKTSIAIKANAITGSDVHADLGELVTGEKIARTSSDDITLFDSSGVATQDAVLAGFLYEEACKRNVGTRVSVFEGLPELLMP